MKYLIHFVILLLIVSSCGEEDKNSSRTGLNCDKIRDSYLSDYTFAKEVVDSICMTLPAMPSAYDVLGHRANTVKLLMELSESCEEMTFELECYGCLESLPVQSSIIVTLDSMNTAVVRYFRLRVPEGDFMYMVN